jgi:hypothetical protein
VGSWTLGDIAGSNTLTATAAGLTDSPVTFTATATAGSATQIAINAGDGQSAAVATAVSTLPSVIIKDANDNPISGVSVTFAVASGGGSITGDIAITDASGIATVGSWTLGDIAGSNTLTATAAGLTDSPVTFTATATVGSGVYTVGETGPGGGIIFYSSAAGFNCGTGFTSNGSPTGGLCHYLEAAPNGWNGSGDPLMTWATGANQSAEVSGADRTGIGAGYLNSLDIVAQVGNAAESSAAVRARQYSGGEKYDWYLPSADELNQLYLQKDIGQGFLWVSVYWSSSEDGAGLARAQDFYGGNQGHGNKSALGHVRPIRAF